MIHIAGDTAKTTLTHIHPEDIQPNAVDLRLDKIFWIKPNMFILSNEERVLRGVEEIQPNDNGYFSLGKGSYEILMENVINVGQDEVGWVITRSTLTRNGLFITGGLYDSGYHGVMGSVLNVTVGPARIKRGTRVGQFLCFKAEALKQYNGFYGIGSEHDKKYNKEI